jgi:hypothetical protein
LAGHRDSAHLVAHSPGVNQRPESQQPPLAGPQPCPGIARHPIRMKKPELAKRLVSEAEAADQLGHMVSQIIANLPNSRAWESSCRDRNSSWNLIPKGEKHLGVVVNGSTSSAVQGARIACELLATGQNPWLSTAGRFPAPGQARLIASWRFTFKKIRGIFERWCDAWKRDGSTPGSIAAGFCPGRICRAP